MDKSSKSQLHKIAKNLLEDKKCATCLHGIFGISTDGSICVVSGELAVTPPDQTCLKWKKRPGKQILSVVWSPIPPINFPISRSAKKRVVRGATREIKRALKNDKS
jgi:hypothetical protein